MMRLHYACIGFPEERREGRYIVTTFRCFVCGKTTRTLVETPTRLQRALDRVYALRRMVSKTCVQTIDFKVMENSAITRGATADSGAASDAYRSLPSTADFGDGGRSRKMFRVKQ